MALPVVCCTDLMAHNTTTREDTSAKVIYSSQLPDIALLKVDRPIGSDHVLESAVRQWIHVDITEHRNPRLSRTKTVAELCEGTEIAVMGYGLRHSPMNLSGPLVSRGVVSKVVCDKDQPVMFLTTAAVNPGMSGGLVASAETGKLLGIVISNSQ